MALKNNTGSIAAVLAVILAAVFAAPASASAVYSLDDCLETALRIHPRVASASASVALSRGQLEQTEITNMPTLDGSLSAAQRGYRDHSSSSYSFGINAGVRLYDANRNRYATDASRASLSAAELEAVHTLSGVRAGVKSAYLNLLMSHERERQRQDAVNAYRQHLEQASGFYDAGTKPWYDVTRAEVDLGNAHLMLAEAVSNTRNARARLANAMGIDPTEDFDVVRTDMNIFSVPDEALRDAEALAIENRPDYLASAFKVDADRAAISVAARSNAATINLSGGYNDTAIDSLDFGGGNWNVGASMSIPIADGGAARIGTEMARVRLTSAEISREELRQSILLEVSQAKSDIAVARERIRISELTLINAEENRRLAEGRYEAGVGTALEVNDALVSYTDAILSSKQAQYDLQIAIVNLEQATGLEFERP